MGSGTPVAAHLTLKQNDTCRKTLFINLIFMRQPQRTTLYVNSIKELS